MTIKNVVISGVALLGLGFAPAISSIATGAQTVQASSVESTKDVDDVVETRDLFQNGVVTVFPGTMARAYDQNGNIVEAYGWFKGGTSWKTDVSYFLNGHRYFRVATNVYLVDGTVSFKAE